MVRSIDVIAASHPDEAVGQVPRPEAKIMAGPPSDDGRELFSAILASMAGQNLERSDLLYLALATKRSLEGTSSRQVAKWCNPDTGSYGEVVLYDENVGADGQAFRHVMHTITAGGQIRQSRTTAFRQLDGTWRLVH